MLFIKVLISAILINTTYAYVFDVLRVNKAGGLKAVNCDFEENTLGINKYKNFMKGNTSYSVDYFSCFNTAYGSECISKIENISCINGTGYEGEFCRNYGGKDSMIYCVSIW